MFDGVCAIDADAGAGFSYVTGINAKVPYTSDVRFVFIDNTTSTITVKTGAQTVAAGNAKALVTVKLTEHLVSP